MNYFWIFRIDIMLECRKLPNCTHLCPETCHPGQCPSPDKCSKKVMISRSSSWKFYEDGLLILLWIAVLFLFDASTSFSCQLFLYKVTVRCQCQTLKKEWPCQDVQAAYQNSGRDPKDISKNHFGIGLLPCNSDCKSKVKVVDQELHLRKSKDLEVPFN